MTKPREAAPAAPRFRLALMAVAATAMALALYGGLLRIGVPLPAGESLVPLHGPLMVSGVFGTLISLERAVAMGGGWPYLAPAAAALGALALLVGLPQVVGAALFVLGGLVLSKTSLRILRLQPELFTLVLLIGAVAWSIGNFCWLVGVAIPDLAGWWLAFFVCTIAAERLELSRVLGQTRAAAMLFIVCIVLLLAGAALGSGTRYGEQLTGAGLLAVTAWLLRYDIAGRTIRQRGQTRFFAAAMLAGYCWLGLAGLYMISGSNGPHAYDLGLHIVLIGFVLSMVFGHALIIVPAVVGLRLRYHQALYVPLAVLHLSVLLRLTGGLLEVPVLRQASGIATTAAIILFAATLLAGTRSSALRQ